MVFQLVKAYIRDQDLVLYLFAWIIDELERRIQFKVSWFMLFTEDIASIDKVLSHKLIS